MMPTFLVIGAAKSGTTSLFRYLRQHPDVFTPERKEASHFAFDRPPAFRGPGAADRPVVERRAYEALFDGAGSETAVGEASVAYLYVPEAPERIRRALPGVRLIAILRHPADRAFSSYLHLMRRGREPAADFAEALALEPARIREGWGFLWRYRDLGFYGRQLARYYALFPADRIRVYLTDDLAADPRGVLRDAFGFLGVDPAFVPDTSIRHNVGGIPRGPLRPLVTHPHLRALPAPLRRLVPAAVRHRSKDLVARATLARPALDPILRAELTRGFAADIAQLAGLIGRDLTHWLADAEWWKG